jgi:hypothetical protein
MGAEKRLQRLMDRVAKKGGNSMTVEGSNRGELQEKLTDNKASSSQWKRAKRLADKVMPEDKPSYQGVKPVKNMSDKQAQSIDEDSYPPTSRKSALNMLGVSRKSSPLNELSPKCWTGFSPGAETGVKTKKGKDGDPVNNCEKD